MALVLPPTFNVPIDGEGGEIRVVWKGEYQRLISQLGSQLLISQFEAVNVEKETHTFTNRTGYSNRPTTEPYTGFAEQTRKMVTAPRGVEQVRDSQGREAGRDTQATDYVLPKGTGSHEELIATITAQVLFRNAFPSVSDEGRVYAFTHYLLSEAREGAPYHQSFNKQCSDLMKLICIGEALEDIVKLPLAGTIVNVTRFDEVPYGVSAEHLKRLRFETRTIAKEIMPSRDFGGMSPRDSKIIQERASIEQQAYENVRDHYLNTTRVKLEAEVFVPK